MKNILHFKEISKKDVKTAGVIFTTNPITNNPKEIMIEASFGLGEAVVSGSVTPDMYIVHKPDLKIKEKTINVQEWRLIGDKEGGTIKQKVENPGKQVITDKEIKELAEISKYIEQHYKSPQDIEWAIRDKIYILQSRPITTIR